MIVKVTGWEKWQSYRSDRGQPPWIKVHRRLLRHAGWVSLTDAHRGQIVQIWMLAADRNGEIDSGETPIAEYIARVGCMDSIPDLAALERQGWLSVVDELPTREEKPGVVYMVTCPDGKSYIGQTTDLKARRRAHENCTGLSPKLESAIKRHGTAKMAWVALAADIPAGDLDSTERRLIDEHGTIAPHGYNVRVGGRGAGVLRVTASRRHGVTEANDVVTHQTRVEENRVQSTEPPHTPPAGGEDGETVEAASASDFEAFWKSYPRGRRGKVGKGAARRAWAKLGKRRPPLAELIEALRLAALSVAWREDGGRFVPNPATWLNQERWSDERDAAPVDHAEDGVVTTRATGRCQCGGFRRSVVRSSAGLVDRCDKCGAERTVEDAE